MPYECHKTCCNIVINKWISKECRVCLKTTKWPDVFAYGLFDCIWKWLKEKSCWPLCSTGLQSDGAGWEDKRCEKRPAQESERIPAFRNGRFLFLTSWPLPGQGHIWKTFHFITIMVTFLLTSSSSSTHVPLYPSNMLHGLLTFVELLNQVPSALYGLKWMYGYFAYSVNGSILIPLQQGINLALSYHVMPPLKSL